MSTPRQPDDRWLFDRLASRKKRRWHLDAEEIRTDLIVLVVAAIFGLFAALALLYQATKDQGPARPGGRGARR